MGQAKNRGSRDDRIADVLEEQSRRIAAVRQGLELPDDAEFCGFLVHIPEMDEFLHTIDDSVARTTRSYIKLPDLAYRFKNFTDAYRWMRPARRETVVGLFSTGDKFVVAQLMGAGV